MQPKTRVTIAQISDLHMNRKVETATTDMLKQILKSKKPDVLVVSGDLANQPVPWQMKKAAKLVREIEEECKPLRTIVIAGNHDFKFWGNVGLRRLTRIPFEIYFRRQGLDRGIRWHLKEVFKLAMNALWWKGTAMREPVISDFFPERPEWGLALFAINSNTLIEMMAGGKVESRDLQELYAMIDEAGKGGASGQATSTPAPTGQPPKPSFDFCYKIAVVHHHPAPIADAPSGAIARIQDSFMIFYNAGLFVRELSRRGFNLVLHGHKHVAGFLRVGCEFEDQGRTVLSIGAAGTAAHPAPDDSRGHHLRIIEIFDDDTARLHEQFFSADVTSTPDSCSYALETLEDVARRRNLIFSRLRRYSTREVVKNVTITTDGYTKVRITERDCRVVKGATLRTIPLSLTTSRPSYVRGVARSDDSSNFVRIDFSEQGLQRIAGQIDLSTDRAPEDGPFDFAYDYRVMNRHVLTAQEFVRHYSGSDVDSESASITCEGACELMTLDVQFPENYDLKQLEFRATAEYVPAPLLGIDDTRLDWGRVKIHETETKRISGSIRPYLNGYVFTCSDPVPGMIYKLRWKFKEPAGKPGQQLSVAAAFESACQKLLRTAENPAEPAAAAELARVRSILQELAGDLDSLVTGPKETPDITVMVFDEDCQRLKFVGTTDLKLPTAAFYSGEGCAGFVFEKARAVLYHAEKDEWGRFIRVAEWPELQQFNEPVVLACFPWFYNPKDDKRKLVAGVANISSTLPTTKLLTLFDLAEAEQTAKMKQLQELVNISTQRLTGV